ncbi:hypothetical protein MMC22_011366 [Lobaria immixta]|nr:hypothetical protein [Lobaria immixta]
MTSTLEHSADRSPGDFHSTLEVRQTDPALYDSFKELSSTSPLPSSYANDIPELAGDLPRGQVADGKKFRTICKLRPNVFWLTLVLVLCVVVAAVCGSLGYTLSHRKSIPETSSANATGPRPSSLTGSPGKRFFGNTSLAAVSWNDTNAVTQYRLFHQDENNLIKESAWNSSSRTWHVSNPAIGNAKAASPIAAVVTGPPHFRFKINLYAIDASNRLLEWFSTDDVTFKPGPLTDLGRLTAENSKVAAVWHRHLGCDMCSNTLLLVYENSDGKLQFGNTTATGWTWSTLAANFIPGSSLSMNIKWQKNHPAGVRVYYQAENQYLSDLRWEYNNSPSLWDLTGDQSFQMIPKGAPITSVVWGVAPGEGRPIWMEILSSGVTGIMVNWWGFNWVWRPLQTPTIMNDGLNNYISLAANADAHVFALEDGNVHEFKMEADGTWALVGDILMA